MFAKMSLKVRYLISFVLILAVMVLLLSFLITTQFATQKNFTNATVLEQFTYSAENVDTLLSRIESSTAGADGLRSILLETPTTSSRWERRIPAALVNLEENLPTSAKVFLYIRGSKNIYSSTEEMAYSEFETMMANTYDLIPSQFFSHIMTLRSKKLIPLYTSDGSRLTGLSYIFPLSSESALYGNPALIYILSDSCITGEFEKYLGVIPGDLYIYDSHFQCLYNHFKEEAPLVAFDQLIKRKGVGISHYSNGLERIAVTNSESGLTCVMVIRSSDLYQEVQNAKRNMLWMALLIVSSLIFLFVWLAFFNYRPIGELMSDIMGKNRVRADMNEIDIIRRFYRQTVEEAESVSLTLNEITPLMTQHFIQELTSGHLTNEDEIRRIASFAGMEVDKPYFGAMYIVPLFPVAEDAELGLNQLLQAFSRFRIPDGDIACGELVDEGAVGVLVNFSSHDQDPAFCLESFARCVLTELERNVSGSVKIGLGSIRTKIQETTDAFAEADAAVRLSSETSITRYDASRTTQSADEESGTLPSMSIALLTEAVRRGDFELASRTLKDVAERLGASTESMLFFRYYAGEIVGNLVRAAQSEQISVDGASLRHLIEFKSRAEFEQNTVDFIQDLCSQINQKQQNNNTALSNSLMDYILAHFKEYNLSIQSVSEALGLRKNQVSVILQESVGMNFVQYVSTLRLKEFKRLLVESDLPINQLISSVGYSDVPNFLRKFKAIEGMTAGNYRTILGKQGIANHKG